MEKLGKLGKEVSLVLHNHRLNMLEISGVDVKRLQVQQEETAKKMAGLAEKIGADFQKRAPATAELHRQAVLSHYKHLTVWPYRCLEFCSQDKALDCVCPEPLLMPEDNPAQAKGSNPCDIAQNTGRPHLELHSSGDGAEGEVACGLTFTFKGENCVKTGGRYRISAFTQANGWRWLHLWGGGCERAQATTGHLKLTVTLFVSQRWDVWDTEYVLLDTTMGGYPDNVYLNRSISLYADLDAGYDVDIKVEFKIDAEMNGYGHCFVDLQSGANYFRVPAVSLCLPCPWQVAGPFLVQEPRLEEARHYLAALKDLLEQPKIPFPPDPYSERFRR